MKIVLKDADFSQSGIPTPHEVVFDGTKYLNVYTGALENNTNVQRGADVSEIAMSNNKLTNSEFGIFASVLFYDSNKTYLGGIVNAILGVGASLRIDQYSTYKKNVNDSLVEMTSQEVETMLANSAYWMLSAQCESGIDAVQVTLDIE